MIGMAMSLYGLSALGATTIERQAMWAGGMHASLVMVHVALLMHAHLQMREQVFPSVSMP